MQSMGRRLRLAAAGACVLATMLVATWANAQGVCKCNNGCHAYPGQCTHSNDCDPGYAPTCDTRPDGGCPQVGWVSCSGGCTCTPIPGWDAGVDAAPEAGPHDAAPDVVPDVVADVVHDVVQDVVADVVHDVVVDVAPDVEPDAPEDAPPDVTYEPCGSLEHPCPPHYQCVQGWCVPDGTDAGVEDAGGFYPFDSSAPPSGPGDDGTGGADAALEGGDAFDDPTAKNSGCSCRTVPDADDIRAVAGAVVAILGLGMLARRRRRT
jgi:MYXO-CTERM domain-containing protein